jgi:hypothetical protein
MIFTTHDLAREMRLEVGDRLLYNGSKITIVEYEAVPSAKLMGYKYDVYSKSCYPLNLLVGGELTFLPCEPTLTKDERIILKNVPKEYKWILREKENMLVLYAYEPTADEYGRYGRDTNQCIGLTAFKHLFQSLKENKPHKIANLLEDTR